MLKVGLLCGVIAAMSATGFKASIDSKIESKPLDAQFIVELEDDIDTIDAEKAIKQQDAIVSKIVHGVNGNAKKDQHFTLLTNSVVVSANKEDIDEIKAIPGVKSVTENATHVVQKSSSSSLTLDLTTYKMSGGTRGIDLNQNVSAETMKLPTTTNKGEGTLIAVLDNEFYLRGKTSEDANTPYNHVAFTALDSGVKQRLSFNDVKALKGLHAKQTSTTRGNEGSLYYNTKVPFYYDYAGDSYTGGSYGAEPDHNVESTVDLHGSHVSSIAAGNDPDYKGIAPNAQLCLMKVFTDVHASPASEAANMGSYGRFNEVSFINALEDCIKIGVDAINVSIGSDLADFEQGSISQKTLQKITDAGILSAISNGNAGKSSYSFTGGYGYWTRDVVETGIMGSFANNASTMSIAAGQPTRTYYENTLRFGDDVIPFDDQIVNRDGMSDYDEEHKLHEVIQDNPNPDVDPTPAELERDVQYVYTKGFGQEKDYKDLVDDKDPTGKVVIVNRGKINFSEKLETAVNHGAAGLIIINNDPTATGFTFRCDFGTKSVSIPVSIVLYRDKQFFDANPYGTFKIGKNSVSENKLAYTVSDFSSDGATYDLDLKPEITTPGSNIKGAVWPQNKKERIETKYSSYEYFDGTSMAAPNYEGAMAVVLSKVAKDTNFTSAAEVANYNKFRNTIDMRFMSTADPMTDDEANGENNEKTLTSPRMQGAGMADIAGAYNTDVYLEGIENGKGINKAKILLRNNDDVAKGKINLSFIAHNESSNNRTYNVSFNVMRPATALCNKVLTSDFHDPVEVDSVKNFPGWQYYSPEEERIIYADGAVSYKDVIKVSKPIEYYENAEQYKAEKPEGVIPEGMYYCADENPDVTKGVKWEEVPNYLYSSVQDIEIAKVDCGAITVDANSDKTINLNSYELTKEQKDKIAELYEKGTYLEGFVTLVAADSSYEDLSIPYMGFYSLSDRNANNSYSTPDVVEEFDFEKDPTKIYASDLVNDVTKQLLGLDKVDFGSTMLAGHINNEAEINTDDILTNKSSFKELSGFYPVGTKPDVYGYSYTDNPSNDIYIGNAASSNTLIVQQFVLRSCDDNNFTIKRVDDGSNKVVYTSALQDLLFGQTFGKNALYKSHVDSNYLGGGYVAHRAYAVIPLYDQATKEAFASGTYEIQFNYLLAGTKKWVSKSYTLHVDAESPLVSSIESFTQNGKEMVRINYKDTRVAYAKVGSNKVDVKYNEETMTYYSDVERSIVDSVINASVKTSFSDSRLFISVVDYARGETTAIVHFDNADLSKYTIVQGQGFDINTDFKYENGNLSLIQVVNGEEINVTSMYKVTMVDGVVTKVGGANLPLILGLSIPGGIIVLGGIGVLIFFLLKKKRKAI